MRARDVMVGLLFAVAILLLVLVGADTAVNEPVYEAAWWPMAGTAFGMLGIALLIIR